MDIYYKTCTLRNNTGREISYSNLFGLTYHGWKNYLVRELNYDLRNWDLFLSDPKEDTINLTSVPGKIGG